MRLTFLLSAWALTGLLAMPTAARAVELKISRAALDRTLRQQLFSGENGRYYLKGDVKAPCSVYAEQPELTFVQDRIVVKVKTRARLGTALAGKCLGLTLSPIAEVSMVPDAQGETIGFRDARVERVSDSKELNFLLMPFSESPDSSEHEGKCGRRAAQGTRRFDPLDRLQTKPRAAEDSLHGHPGRLAGGGCGRRHDREVVTSSGHEQSAIYARAESKRDHFGC